MNKSTSVVEINGNQYDAVTGQLIGVVEKISQQVKKPANGSSIDGFARRSTVVAQKVHRQAQRSQTLMRTAVKRPAKTDHSHAHKTGKARSAALDPLRFSRAGIITKSMKVSHFGHPEGQKSAGNAPTAEGEVLAASRHTQPKPQSLAVTKSMPSLVTSASHQQLERLLDLALFQADSHKQKLDKRGASGLWKRLRTMPNWRAAAAGLFAVLLLTAFFAWQRVPQVALKVAAARAHISAAMPSYVPRGYSFAGPVKYADRSVTIRFRGASDTGKTFELTQAASNMNSTSFAATMLPHGAQTQTSQVKGTTVYVYGQTNNAAWVNHGIAYTIKDAANLNTDQLLKIADSL